MYQVRQRETKTVICEEKTLAEAINTVKIFANEDVDNNEYEEDYYDIFDVKNDVVVDLEFTT